MRSVADSSEYQRGIVLFNAGQYFEAHEALETLWRQAEGIERLFYQGLIQAAVALHHARRGNSRAARRLIERALARLDQVPSPFHGLDVADFAAQLRQWASLEDPAQGPIPRIALLSEEASGDLTARR